MAETVFNRVESVLKRHGITFQVMQHEPVYTSEEAARVRGTPLASGAKALIVKGSEGFVMFVVPADRKLDSHAVRVRSAGRRCGCQPRGSHGTDRPHARRHPAVR